MKKRPAFDILPDTSALKPIKQKNIFYLFGAFLVFVIACWVIASVAGDVAAKASPLAYVIFFIFIFLFGQAGLKFQQERHEQLKEFAARNGWKREFAMTDAGLGQKLFNTGHSRKFTNPLVGTYFDMLFRMFEYRFAEGSGKYRRDYHLRVIALGLTRHLPNIYIDRLKEISIWYGDSPTTYVPGLFNPSQRVKLEGDFGNKFNVYIPDEYEISALTILAPDVMQAILDAPAVCDIEIYENNIYFYFPNYQFEKANLDSTFMTVNKIMKEVYKSLTATNIYKSEVHMELHELEDTALLKTRRWNTSTLVLILAIVLPLLIGLLIGILTATTGG